MNGHEATRRIRLIYPDLPIISLTAYAMSDDIQRSIDAGCNAHISKPFKPSELLNKLEVFVQDIQIKIDLKRLLISNMFYFYCYLLMALNICPQSGHWKISKMRLDSLLKALPNHCLSRNMKSRKTCRALSSFSLIHRMSTP
ncbi:MAG: response regulator [Bacteroidales bacterium]